MKAAFISDIHGNAVALEEVLRDIEQRAVDKIFVLGDICYRGPEPKRALELIQSLQTEVIKGNADEWVVRGVQQGEVPDHLLDLMNKEREWTVSKLDHTDMDYLEQLPTAIHYKHDDVSLTAFHAVPDNLFKVILPNADDEVLDTEIVKKANADIYVYAHIHKPYIRYANEKIIMNIGSVGLPFDGMRMASYGIVTIEQNRISTSIERVAYDTEKVISLYHSVNYPNMNMTNVIKNAKV
ncbi:metallophosphoesterase family protein [Paenibacillus sp. GXUN7292]|uniref:metallophosphoesterase family protein n=1 Tax=Paenibacillus sp. GXUN7292 TaxID=3422499 RepID=UPI003D7EDF8A